MWLAKPGTAPLLLQGIRYIRYIRHTFVTFAPTLATRNKLRTSNLELAQSSSNNFIGLLATEVLSPDVTMERKQTVSIQHLSVKMAGFQQKAAI